MSADHTDHRDRIQGLCTLVLAPLRNLVLGVDTVHSSGERDRRKPMVPDQGPEQGNLFLLDHLGLGI